MAKFERYSMATMAHCTKGLLKDDLVEAAPRPLVSSGHDRMKFATSLRGC